MNVRLRPYDARHFEFARKLYFETMLGHYCRWSTVIHWRLRSVGSGMKLNRSGSIANEAVISV